LKLKTGSVSKYFLQDHLGSTTALTNSSGSIIESATYDSFGNATGNLSTRYQFTGREFDADIGLQYSRARWYSAELGRFISEDPIGFAGGDVNIYNYVGDNLLNGTDPKGLSVEATYSQSQGVFTVKEWRGGLGIMDYFLGPLRNEQYGAFSGCNCGKSESDVSGPIPKGVYLIDKDRDVNGDVPWKRVSHRLLASQSGTLEGPFDYNREVTNPNTGEKVKRDNFYLHPGSVSAGCITLPKTRNLEDGAPWSDEYESLDKMIINTSPYYHSGRRGTGVFAGTLIVTE
jgi:RHS repeat-associated protein